LTLARAVDDEQLSDEILRAARRTLIEAIEGEASKPRRRKRVYQVQAFARQKRPG
jgi:hypothetical protein